MKDDTRLQRHIGSTIAINVWHYHQATGDDSFMAEYGAELMVDICRFWCSLARHHEADDRFDIRGVVGPDEYHTPIRARRRRASTTTPTPTSWPLWCCGAR